MPDTLAPAHPLARGQVIDGLRQLADYLERNPDVPVHESGWDLLVFAYEETGRSEVDHVAAVLGVRPGDSPGGGHYVAARTFGRITYNFVHLTPRNTGRRRPG